MCSLTIQKIIEYDPEKQSMKSLYLQFGINYISLRSYHSEIKMNRFKSKSKYENPGRPHNLSLELKYEIINQTKILNPRIATKIMRVFNTYLRRYFLLKLTFKIALKSRLIVGLPTLA